MGRLTENTTIKKREQSHKVYSHEDYAQELYELYCDSFEGKKIAPKDMTIGNLCKANVVYINESSNLCIVQSDTSQSISLDLLKENKFLLKHGANKIAVGMNLDLMIESENKGSYSGSLEKAYKNTVKSDLMKSLKDGSSAYKVKIKSINDGGFMVDLSGLECFMPGSLAAANKITNFESMIGKEVLVMVENYLETTDMFVMSNKKYIQSVLPKKVKELSFTESYTGTVTGVMGYGAFIEWDSIFTGLLHESEADNLKSLRAGDEIKIWIKEIKEGKEAKDIRIILSQKGASPEYILYQEFKEQHEGKDFENATVKDVKPFGTFVELKSGIIGMLSPREHKKLNHKEGSIDVFIKNVDVASKKITLKADDEE